MARRAGSGTTLQRVLVLFFLGLLGVGAAGVGAVQGTILTTRGEPMAVFALAHGETDSAGWRSYELIGATDLTPVRGDLRTDQKLFGGQLVTVLVDPAEFVGPALPEDVDSVRWLLVVVPCVGCLAVSTIGLGFPLGPGRRAEQPDVVT